MRQTHKCVRREKACVTLIYRQEPLHAGRQMLWLQEMYTSLFHVCLQHQSRIIVKEYVSDFPFVQIGL